MIRRKESLVRGSPHRISGGSDLPGRFIIPSHNLTMHDCGLPPFFPHPLLPAH